MSWAIEFEAPKGQRFHRYFWNAQIEDDRTPILWWFDHLNKFAPTDDQLKLYARSNCSKTIHTYKAFLSFLDNHPELKGRDIRLVNKYVGQDIYAKAI